MTSQIHPTAIIGPNVQLGMDVKIGPYCVVTGNITLHDRVELIAHVTISGHTVIGADTTIFPFASIGHVPQDKKYRGEDSVLIIGERNTIREYVTMQPGTDVTGIMKTVVGNDCLFMAGTHVAHDCVLGNNIIMANLATLAGHVVVEDFAIIGGLSAVHQFVRIGRGAIIGGMSAVEHDVIPYGSVKGERAYIAGVNFVGMKRRGFTRTEIQAVLQTYRGLFAREKTLSERVEKLREVFQHQPRAMEILDFVCADSSRSLCMPKDYYDDAQTTENDAQTTEPTTTTNV
jgi:UDP-N-acetylglucosamine acyltransferase